MCGKKGHIIPDCPLKEDEQADEQVDDDATPKPKSSLKKKAVQFVATTADDEGDSRRNWKTITPREQTVIHKT